MNTVIGYIFVLVGFVVAFVGALMSMNPDDNKAIGGALFGLILILAGGFIARGDFVKIMFGS